MVESDLSNNASRKNGINFPRGNPAIPRESQNPVGTGLAGRDFLSYSKKWGNPVPVPYEHWVKDPIDP
jgi:hypothetical protein